MPSAAALALILVPVAVVASGGTYVLVRMRDRYRAEVRRDEEWERRKEKPGA